MTLFIDANLMTATIATPIREGWFSTQCAVEVVPNLSAAQVSAFDVALISVPEASLLSASHVLEPSFGVVAGSNSQISGPVSLCTPVRADEIEHAIIRLHGVGATAEALIRAALRPYFGITADRFVRDENDPAIDEATAVVIDDIDALAPPAFGFAEDLVRAWYVLTGMPPVYALTVIGNEVEDPEPELATLREAVTVGVERRREIRGLLTDGNDDVDRTLLAEMTNNLTYDLSSDHLQSAGMLLQRGTWGTDWRRTFPPLRTMPD